MSEKELGFKVIEALYYQLENLCDDCTESPETKEASKKFWEYLYVHNLIGNAVSVHRIPLDDLITEIGVSYEKQGFIYGFRCAVKLMMS